MNPRHETNPRQPTQGVALIEMFGPASAGKTTITRMLSRRVEQVQFGCSLPRRRYAHYFLLRALAAGPGPCAGLLLGSGQNRRLAKARILLDVLYDVFGSSQGRATALGRDRQPDPLALVFDQGPLYLLSAIHPTMKDGDKLHDAPRWWRDSLARWSNTLDVVVSLDAPEETLIGRVIDREKDHPLFHRLKDASSHDALRTMEIRRSVFQEILNGVGRGSARVLSFDTSQQSAEAIVEEIIQQCELPSPCDRRK